MDYEPKEPAQYRPGVVRAEGPHFTLTQARNPDLNGDFTFRYPTAFDEISIGARVTELVNAGRVQPVKLELLPFRAQQYVLAIATLEATIKAAPKGWYVHTDAGFPLLAPGAVGDGDEEVVLLAYEGFLNWKRRFRESVAGARAPEEAQDMVSGAEDQRGDAA
ncbi:hypothetical protein [Calidithermus chliarophilus]|uniref:hypothetical protein n=1 Tax=Calidithermus chliarophilus TaxID=52023 RepID=UPI000411AD6B|nr:hypothetical protein [Calidithermus chliarophilus]